MNMDELLNSVWNEEGNPFSSNSIQNEASYDDNVATPMHLPRQASFAIPTPICKKTVEEVWAEINRIQSPTQNPNTFSNNLSEREQTFGEITLEDFLIKVGVIHEPCTPLPPQQEMVDCVQNPCGNFLSDDASVDPGIGPGPMTSLGFSHLNDGNNFQGNGSPMYQVFTPTGSFVGESSNNNVDGNGKSNGVGGDPLTKRRTTSGSFELAVERRQRRMIKNRESAARSRARKQAYTAELEIELNQLREENAKLKVIMAEAENKRKPEVTEGKPLTKAQRTAEKIKTMRRTSSSACGDPAIRTASVFDRDSASHAGMPVEGCLYCQH
ncbi:hypothetical protein Vadar_009284 [Vaccinium darrowii]|uniref:Uncharacterized protein n=1 Tax=Vaccinium darrowii TaxID=229202 RepID=A0ACB7X8I6_9ERIC|nr:hypothetical protein Vadar_009284 [Vaccinium darrowii]